MFSLLHLPIRSESVYVLLDRRTKTQGDWFNLFRPPSYYATSHMDGNSKKSFDNQTYDTAFPNIPSIRIPEILPFPISLTKIEICTRITYIIWLLVEPDLQELFYPSSFLSLASNGILFFIMRIFTHHRFWIFLITTFFTSFYLQFKYTVIIIQYYYRHTRVTRRILNATTNLRKTITLINSILKKRVPNQIY